MSHSHLAYISIGQAREPLGSELMNGYQARLTEVNAAAIESAGFVMRIPSDPTGDPPLLVEISVWKNLDSLKAFAFRSRHASFFAERDVWFEKAEVPQQALWWIPAGHIPTREEAVLRLERLRSAQPTRFAFTFTHAFAAPPDPPAPGLGPFPQVYNDKRLQVIMNTEAAGVGPGQIFHYHQDGSRVWCVYHSEATRFGSAVGTVDEAGNLDLRYQHLDPKGTPRTGKCLSTPEPLPDGRLRVHEVWQWTNGDGSKGESVLEELAP
jgi:Domain of unknown function (DUF3291)